MLELDLLIEKIMY